MPSGSTGFSVADHGAGQVFALLGLAVSSPKESTFPDRADVIRICVMSTITIAVPDPLDTALVARMNAVGARSKEEYLLALIESDCAASELERVLVDRLAGPFEPLETDWKERVRQSAAK